MDVHDVRVLNMEYITGRNRIGLVDIITNYPDGLLFNSVNPRTRELGRWNFYKIVENPSFSDLMVKQFSNLDWIEFGILFNHNVSSRYRAFYAKLYGLDNFSRYIDEKLVHGECDLIIDKYILDEIMNMLLDIEPNVRVEFLNEFLKLGVLTIEGVNHLNTTQFSSYITWNEFRYINLDVALFMIENGLVQVDIIYSLILRDEVLNEEQADRLMRLVDSNSDLFHLSLYVIPYRVDSITYLQLYMNYKRRNISNYEASYLVRITDDVELLRCIFELVEDNYRNNLLSFAHIDDELAIEIFQNREYQSEGWINLFRNPNLSIDLKRNVMRGYINPYIDINYLVEEEAIPPESELAYELLQHMDPDNYDDDDPCDISSLLIRLAQHPDLILCNLTWENAHDNSITVHDFNSLLLIMEVKELQELNQDPPIALKYIGEVNDQLIEYIRTSPSKMYIDWYELTMNVESKLIIQNPELPWNIDAIHNRLYEPEKRYTSTKSARKLS
jgi:hypothetical protein